MSPTRTTTADQLKEHEQRLNEHDNVLLIIQEQFTAFQTLVHEQLATINKVVDSLKDTKTDVVRLQEKSTFDDWKRAIIVGIVMTLIGTGAGVTSTLLYQVLSHIHP
jgi:hypothetical protein